MDICVVIAQNTVGLTPLAVRSRLITLTIRRSDQHTETIEGEKEKALTFTFRSLQFRQPRLDLRGLTDTVLVRGA